MCEFFHLYPIIYRILIINQQLCQLRILSLCLITIYNIHTPICPSPLPLHYTCYRYIIIHLLANLEGRKLY